MLHNVFVGDESYYLRLISQAAVTIAAIFTMTEITKGWIRKLRKLYNKERKIVKMMNIVLAFNYRTNGVAEKYDAEDHGGAEKCESKFVIAESTLPLVFSYPKLGEL